MQPSVSTCWGKYYGLADYKFSQGGADMLDISQSFPEGVLVVSYFSFLLGANYQRLTSFWF